MRWHGSERRKRTCDESHSSGTLLPGGDLSAPHGQAASQIGTSGSHSNSALVLPNLVPAADPDVTPKLLGAPKSTVGLVKSASDSPSLSPSSSTALGCRETCLPSIAGALAFEVCGSPGGGLASPGRRLLLAPRDLSHARVSDKGPPLPPRRQRSAGSSLLWPQASAVSSQYKLVWADEFDYVGAPSQSRWEFQVDANDWVHDDNHCELQHFTDRLENPRVCRPRPATASTNVAVASAG